MYHWGGDVSCHRFVVVSTSAPHYRPTAVVRDGYKLFNTFIVLLNVLHIRSQGCDDVR